MRKCIDCGKEYKMDDVASPVHCERCDDVHARARRITEKRRKDANAGAKVSDRIKAVFNETRAPAGQSPWSSMWGLFLGGFFLATAAQAFLRWIPAEVLLGLAFAGLLPLGALVVGHAKAVQDAWKHPISREKWRRQEHAWRNGE